MHGVVTDQSAGAMPGVTVTLASPALLVPQTTVTDASGSYHFEQLPVGVYKVTFDLSGFRQYIRENIQITPGFSAEVKVQMSVGAIEESITVSAASPVVDTTSTTVSTSVGAQNADERAAGDAHDAGDGVDRAGRDADGGARSRRRKHRQLRAVGLRHHGSVDGAHRRHQHPEEQQQRGRRLSTFTGLEEMQVVPTGGDAQTALPGVFLNAIVKSGGNASFTAGRG